MRPDAGVPSSPRDDFPLLSTWLARTHVAEWWHHDPSPEGVEAAFGPSVEGADPTELYVVLADGAPIGLIQRYLIGDNPDWQQTLAVVGAPGDAVGIDYFIGEERSIGRGIGSAMIGEFVDDTWRRYTDIVAVVVAVLQANRRSWRVLEKAGFVRVWAGELASDDPSDHGPSYVYWLDRPSPAATA